MEEPKAPENQDKQDGPDLRLFNQDAREAMETQFAEFQQAEAEELAKELGATPPATTPAPEAPPDKPAAAKGPGAVPPETRPESWTPEFKDHETAEKSYRESRKKMTEATERAARLERENEELRRAAAEAIANFQQQSAPPQYPVTEKQPATPMTREELDARFFEDPTGFVFAMIEAGRRAALNEFEGKTKAEREQERRQNAVAAFTRTTQGYFDETYADLKPVEPLVTAEIQQVWNDPQFMKPVLEDKGRNVVAKAKAVVDEATRRLRERLPDIGKSLGLSGSGEPTTERLTSGAPPVVPGGSAGPPMRPSAVPAAETNEEYMAGRRTALDRMQAARMVR